MKEIQGKSILVRFSLRFELARVRVIGSQLVFGDNNFFELKLFPLIFKKTKTEFINE